MSSVGRGAELAEAMSDNAGIIGCAGRQRPSWWAAKTLPSLEIHSPPSKYPPRKKNRSKIQLMAATEESISPWTEAPSAVLPLAAARVAENSCQGFTAKEINSHPGFGEVNFKTAAGVGAGLRREGVRSRCQSLNRYAYVLNNPTTLTDPVGLEPPPHIKLLDPSTCDNIACPGPGLFTGGAGGGAVFGNDIFDAISGAPGTYLTQDMYGNVASSADLFCRSAVFAFGKWPGRVAGKQR
jgi:hypothetical protein